MEDRRVLILESDEIIEAAYSKEIEKAEKFLESVSIPQEVLGTSYAALTTSDNPYVFSYCFGKKKEVGVVFSLTEEKLEEGLQMALVGIGGDEDREGAWMWPTFRTKYDSGDKAMYAALFAVEGAFKIDDGVVNEH